MPLSGRAGFAGSAVCAADLERMDPSCGVTRIAITGASGNGKTTLARAVAERAGLRFVEIDALNHIGPNWTEATPEELREKVEQALSGDGWVTDATYRNKLRGLVQARADTIVWLDLPLRIVLWRLLRRTHRRIRDRTVLWGGNVESSWPDAIRFLIWPAVRSHFRNRREPFLREANVVRLRSPAEVERWVQSQARSASSAERTGGGGAGGPGGSPA
jgi:adenylate kinase family enzyme